MVAKIINAPTNLFIRFLSWLNRNSTKLLDDEKNKFKIFVKSRNGDPFFGAWSISVKPTKDDVERLHDKYDRKADAKTSTRSQVARSLQWVTLMLFSGIITGIPSLDVSDKFKIILTITGVFVGMVIARIQKSKLITIRIDAYKYRLKQICLEEIYVKKGFLPADVSVNKALRGSLSTNEEDRDVEYEKYSLTNLELIIVFLIQIMYLGALLIALLNILIIP